MIILPAIDIIDGKVVRLVKGDYGKVTVYGDDPVSTAKGFKRKGAGHIHIVDLDGAKTGGTPNYGTVCRIIEESGLACEVGGGVRDISVCGKYIKAGAERVVIGTAAVKNPDFLKEAVDRYGGKIAVGVDIRDGYVAVKGWTESSKYTCFDFCGNLEKIGVETVICTDISKDGMLSGPNIGLYRSLASNFTMKIIASGGVSAESDIRDLRDIGVYGAILGKALYDGKMSLENAIKAGGK